MTRFFAAVAVLWLAVAATPSAAAADLAGVPIHGYEIVQTLPHDPDAFTQGLVYADGVFYEGTGGYGASRLRIVEPATGRVLRERRLPAVYFGEGIALLAGKIYQLTWRAGRGFVYAAD
ncbi:MAG TPA: glutaminyl-peptide cyclotransferase, partial [Burkholderiales bacterium]